MTIKQLEQEIQKYHKGQGITFYMSILIMDKTLIRDLYRELAFARFNGEN
jgi:hypothetical protein